jgi:cysteine desulfurase family protein (TIGR01976 family)
MFDVEAVRARFPALARTQGGLPAVLVDAPGGSQVPDTVIDAVAGHLRRGLSNAGGAFATSRETDAVVVDARTAAADLVGADPAEIVLGPNSTTLLFHLARSVAKTLGPGDEVVVTRLDHDANVRPWLRAAEDSGATVRWVDVDAADVTLDEASFDKALSDRTRLVALTLASNGVGTITPATRLVDRAKATGATVVVDGVHLAQHRAIDFHALGADVLAVSPYKVYGPHLGLLAVRGEVLESLDPYRVRPADEYRGPARWETGTQNHEGLAGLPAAVEYLAWCGRTFGAPADGTRRAQVVAAFDAFRAHERGLALSFLDRVQHVPQLRLYGIAEPARIGERTPTFAIRLGEQDPAKTASALGDRGIFVWDGHYYAIELFERLGLLATGGAVRIGFCHYHTPQEIERVVEALTSLA